MTWDPTQPPTGTALLSAPIRENFQALDALVAGGVINPMTAPGDLIRGGPAGAPTRLAPGTNGHVLTLAAGLPTWAALPADVGFVNPMTTLGDLIVGDTAGAPLRLGIGTTGQRLTVVGGVPVWQTPPAVVPAYPLLAPDGTAAAPSYSFANDTGTGLWRDGTNRLSISIGGTFGFRFTGPAFLSMRSDALLRWVPSTDVTAVPDVALARDGSGIFAQRNGVNAQTFRLYNTFTDASNGEWLEFNWATAANTAVMRANKNGSGTARLLEVRYGAQPGSGSAIQVPIAPESPLLLSALGLASAATNGRVNIGNGTVNPSTSGASPTLKLRELFAPTATSTMVALPLYLNPEINYSNATPGAGSYEALKIAVTETALPTGQSYMIRASGGAAGTLDRFAVLRDGTTRIFPEYTDSGNHSYIEIGGASPVASFNLNKIGAGTFTNLRWNIPAGGAYDWRVANSMKWQISAAFHFTPGADNAQDIGQASGRIGIRYIYISTAANFAAVAAPTTPLAGTGHLYMKADKKLYFKDDAGVETALW